MKNVTPMTAPHAAGCEYLHAFNRCDENARSDMPGILVEVSLVDLAACGAVLQGPHFHERGAVSLRALASVFVDTHPRRSTMDSK